MKKKKQKSFFKGELVAILKVLRFPFKIILSLILIIFQLLVAIITYILKEMADMLDDDFSEGEGLEPDETFDDSDISDGTLC